MPRHQFALVALSVLVAVLPAVSLARTDLLGSASELNSTVLRPLKPLFRAVAHDPSVGPGDEGVVRLVQKVEFGRVSWIELRPTATGTMSTDTRHNPHFRPGEDGPVPLTVLENGNWRLLFPGSASSIVSLR